jgi:hypothetical protein
MFASARREDPQTPTKLADEPPGEPEWYVCPVNADSSELVPTAAERARYFSLWVLVAITGIVLALITLRPQPPNSNVLSRLAAAQALVENGTIAIDNVPVTSQIIDKVFARGHFYSDKPAGLSLLAAIIYYPLYHAGFRLSMGRNLAYSVITFLLMGGSCLACLAAFYRALGVVGLRQRACLIMTAGLAFGTLMLPWSITLNNHAFSGEWIFIAFYFLLKTQYAEREKIQRNLALAGAAIGLAASTDSACLLFVVGFGVYVLISMKLRGGVLWYAVTAFLVILPTIAINYTITGDLRPAAAHAELFNYPGSYWTQSSEHLSGIVRNDFSFAMRYAWRCLAGPDGFLLYNPLLVIALYQGFRLIIGRKAFWREALLAFILATMFVGYFCLYTSNYGGFSYSIRWFVTLIPLVWFFAFPFFAQPAHAKAWIYGVLFSLSLIIALIGTLDPWPPTKGGNSALLINWRAHVAPHIPLLRSLASRP